MKEDIKAIVYLRGIAPARLEGFRLDFRNRFEVYDDVTVGYAILRFGSAAELQRFKEYWAVVAERPDYLSVHWYRKYTFAELAAAPLLRVWITRPEKGSGGPKYGTTYDFSTACPVCGTGARQSSELVLDPTEVERAGVITQTFYHERLVSPFLGNVLESAGLTGLQLQPVRFTHAARCPAWLQMTPSETLPRMLADSKGIKREDECATCDRNGYYLEPSVPEEIRYDASVVRPEDLPDVVHSWEHFGLTEIRTPFSESVFGQPALFVKPKFLEAFRSIRARGITFIPVRFV